MSAATNLEISGWSPVKIAVILITVCILRLLFAFCKPAYNPSKVPIVGLTPGFFGRLRAIPLVLGHANKMVIDGFSRYCSGENPTAFLAPWNLTNYIHILPPELISECGSAPEDTLSLVAAFRGEFGVQAFGASEESINKPYHQAILRQKLTGSLERLLEPLREELELAFKEEWEQKWVDREQEGGWVDVIILHQAMDIVARITNRALSGMSLCRDKDFLKNAVDFAVAAGVACFKVQLCPRELQWLIEPLIALRNRQRLAFAAKKMRPIIEERKAIIEHNMENQEHQVNVPEDLLQNLVEGATKLGLPYSSVEEITTCYLNTHFAALHTTSMTFSHALANMAAYRDSTGQRYWDLLREEVLAVDKDSEEGPGIWTRRKLNKLVGMDSLIRESLRLDMTPAVGLIRKVVAKEGYTFSNGFHLKQGVLVGAPSSCINSGSNSTKAGADAPGFDGFRFSRPYHELTNTPAADISAISGVGKHAAVTISDQYLAFGHGKHACPGRFFAISEIKMLLMYCVLNYEVETQERVPPRFVLGMQMSSKDIKLRMRMRREPNASS